MRARRWRRRKCGRTGATWGKRLSLSFRARNKDLSHDSSGLVPFLIPDSFLLDLWAPRTDPTKGTTADRCYSYVNVKHNFRWIRYVLLLNLNKHFSSAWSKKHCFSRLLDFMFQLLVQTSTTTSCSLQHGSEHLDPAEKMMINARWGAHVWGERRGGGTRRSCSSSGHNGALVASPGALSVCTCGLGCWAASQAPRSPQDPPPPWLLPTCFSTDILSGAARWISHVPAQTARFIRRFSPNSVTSGLDGYFSFHNI